MAKVKIARADTELGTIDESELEAAQASGFRVVDETEATEIKTRREAQSGTGMVTGLAEAGARGLSLGLSDVALTELGVDAAGMEARRENLGTLGTGAEIVGAVAPSLVSGGAGAVGTAARLTPAGLAARGGASLGRGVSAALGGGRAAGLAGLSAAGAVEGALQGAGQVLSEDALGDRELSAERMLAGAGRGAALGGLIGGGVGAAGMGLASVARGGQRVSRAAVERLTGVADDISPGLRAEGGLVGRAQDLQLSVMGGSTSQFQARRHLSGLTRTPAGRTLFRDAQGGNIDALVGGRLRKSVGGTSLDDAVGRFERGLAKEAKAGHKGAMETRETLAKWTRTAETDPALAGLSAPLSPAAGKQVRKILGRNQQDLVAGAAKAHRWTSQAADQIDDYAAQLRAAGSPDGDALAQMVGPLRKTVDDPLIWGAKGAAGRKLYAAQKLEQEALGRLPKNLRDISALDEAAYTRLARHPEAVSDLVKARGQIADVLEKQGADVGKVRQGLDDVKRALDYRGELHKAKGAIDDLKSLESGTRGQVARRGLESLGALTGGGFGGLPGLFAGRLTGEVAGMATRPLAAIQTMARMRQAIDAVAGKEGAFIRAAENLAEGGVKAARAVGRQGGRGARTAVLSEARTKQLHTIRRTVQQLAAKPETIPDKMGEGMNEIRAVAPGVADTMTERAARAVSFLASKAPSVYEPPFSTGDPVADPIAMERFGRYVDAVNDPLGAVRGVESGTLDLESAETLRTVYPKIYERIQGDVLEMVGKRAQAGKPVSHLARVQLGLLLDLPLDESLRPGFGQPPPEMPEEAPAGEVRAAAKVEPAKNVTTGMARLEAGERA